jgi:5-methyltetrahydrofolate--homocysteine methyltransferase
VGDGFERDELFLPELVGAASAMQAAMPVLQEQVEKSGVVRQSLGVIIIGTVFGDIHTIGKTMVTTLCAAEGFEVHDLGVNVTAEGFIEGIKEYHADILAMSALMTMTVPQIRKVIHTLKEQGLRDQVKVLVGGAGVTESFAEAVGADGYDPTAPGAAKLARKLVGK